MLLLLALSACVGPERTPVEAQPATAAATSEPASSAAAPAAPAAAEEELSITLDPEEMVYDEGKGVVTFSPDSRRQSATYSHYVLTIASLETAVGGRPTAPVTVAIRATRTVKNWTPKDPNAPAPMGGFDDITYTGVVLRKQ